MKLAIVGHPMIHVRQHRFYEHVASLGHDVLGIAPDHWGNDQQAPFHRAFATGAFRLNTVRATTLQPRVNVYNFTFPGMETDLSLMNPDWVYINQEPESALARQVIDWRINTGARSRVALFTWENLQPRNEDAQKVLTACDLVVCGNDDAERLAKPYAKKTAIMLQVGVDTEHFQARPGVVRDVPVAYAGRITEEKGIEQISKAWPTTLFLEWKPWLQMPWWYSRIGVLVNYSQDRPFWREQAPNYVSCEGMACGCAVVTSDGGSIPFWLKQCPGSIIVSQKDIQALRDAIEGLTKDPERKTRMAQEGRDWVEKNLSTRTTATKLMMLLEEP